MVTQILSVSGVSGPTGLMPLLYFTSRRYKERVLMARRVLDVFSMDSREATIDFSVRASLRVRTG